MTDDATPPTDAAPATDATSTDRADRADRQERDRVGDARGPFPATDVPTDLPADADPHRCPYCDRPLPGERLLALHLGERHADRLSPAERESFAAAEDGEVDDLFVYHLKVVALIVLVVMGLSYVYAFALA
jgi:hypothetical protein